MSQITEEILKKAEGYHYKFQIGCYFSDFKDIDGAKIIWSEKIDDYYWNYAGEVDTSEEKIEDLIEKIIEFYKQRGRQPSIYISPFTKPTNIRDLLENKGFKMVYKDAWMFWEKEELVITLPPGFSFKKIQTDEEMKILVSLFEDSHTGGADEPYGTLSPPYKECLFNFKSGKHFGKQVDHFIGYLDEQPVTFGTNVFSGEFGGMYNGGTIPEFRKRGLNTALSMVRVKDLMDQGVKIIFLQTEKDSYNEKIFSDRGFVTEVIGEGWVLEEK